MVRVEVAHMCFVAEGAHYRRALEITEPESRLRSLAALGRINALACIMSARHGWIGASFSVCEVLTALYFELGERRVVLSKGHAAAMQYACLYGVGAIDGEALLSYKDGPAGLQAHTDVATPGILVNTGSLGQALSKTAGLAFARPEEKFFAVLGDGELQEGQCFEALQTVAHRRLRNLVVIIDANGYQTARAVDEVKSIESRPLALRGLGFDVAEVDGHDPVALARELSLETRRPRAIVAITVKGGGSAALLAAAPPKEWHGRVPEGDLAQKIVDEQVALAGLAALREDWARHEAAPARAEPAVAAEEKRGSTGEAFAEALGRLAAADERVVVLDADLASPCGLEVLSRALPEDRFVEMGIAEQDMVSFAGGLALAGRLPVTNTYAAFYKRAIDQVASNATEGTRVVYAGHYAGLGYYTDGKSHQCLEDVGLFRAVPGMVVADPVDALETERLLGWAVTDADGPVYFRLRRTSAGLDGEPLLAEARARAAGGAPAIERPLVVGEAGARRCFVASGPAAARLALDARRRPPLSSWGVVVQSVFGVALDLPLWEEILSSADRVVTIEEGDPATGLGSLVRSLVVELGLGDVEVRSLAPEGVRSSFRSLEACLEHHGFTVDRLARLAEGG